MAERFAPLASGLLLPAEYVGSGAATSGKVLTAQGAGIPPAWADPAGGSLSFEDLTDVDMTGVADGDVPTWDDGTSTWLPGSGGGGGVTLSVIDLPPASPNGKDEEFESTTLSAWTFVASSGTPTNGDISLFDRANPTNPSWNAHDQVPSTLLMQPKAGTFFKAYRAFAPTSGTRWAIIAKVMLGNRDAGEDGAGINVYKETPGTSNYYPTDGVLLEVYSGVASTFRVNGGSASGRSTSSQGNRSSWYLAISSRTDNSIDTWCSKDGIAWEFLTNYSGLNINGAVANAVIHVRDATGSVPAYGALGWIRFLEGSNTLWDVVGFPSGGDMLLDEIGDVDATSPSDGDGLFYDSGTGHWVASAPSGGGTPLAATAYTAGSDTQVKNTSSASLVDVDATNAAITFTAPASGKVRVQVEAMMDHNATGFAEWGLRESSTTVAGPTLTNGQSTTALRMVATWRLTGVSAGSHTYKFAILCTSGGATSIYSGPTYGAILMTVWEDV